MGKTVADSNGRLVVFTFALTLVLGMAVGCHKNRPHTETGKGLVQAHRSAMIEASGARSGLMFVLDPSEWTISIEKTLELLYSELPADFHSVLNQKLANSPSPLRTIFQVLADNTYDTWQDPKGLNAQAPIVVSLFEPESVGVSDLLGLLLAPQLPELFPMHHRVIVPASGSEVLSGEFEQLLERLDWQSLTPVSARNREHKRFALPSGNGMMIIIPHRNYVRLEIATIDGFGELKEERIMDVAQRMIERTPEQDTPVNTPAALFVERTDGFAAILGRAWQLQTLGMHTGLNHIIPAALSNKSENPERDRSLLQVAVGMIGQASLYLSSEGADADDLAKVYDIENGSRWTNITSITPLGHKGYTSLLENNGQDLLEVYGLKRTESQAELLEFAQLFSRCGLICWAQMGFRKPIASTAKFLSMGKDVPLPIDVSADENDPAKKFRLEMNMTVDEHRSPVESNFSEYLRIPDMSQVQWRLPEETRAADVHEPMAQVLKRVFKAYGDQESAAPDQRIQIFTSTFDESSETLKQAMNDENQSKLATLVTELLLDDIKRSSETDTTKHSDFFTRTCEQGFEVACKIVPAD